ncbi:BTB/POZ domain-containing protein [Megavirus baoshan]|uniref:BTB/POZ domain-containing protein n=1 Tax=Megavirus baoshan TaxID=2496520 RepID=A0A3S8UYN7_9VIRU|nr:BTB/POZ domain-containing protein [Megavirus baoshan]AZL89829.1 BTB/POZ domain-containing protein [Megavirus baoshan]
MESFSDITLEITDNNNTIMLPFYRIILYNSSEYFKKLLTLFMEKDSKQVKINVPNADIAYNIITNFIEKHSSEPIEKRKINIPSWEYIIDEYKCLDYFMLEKDITKIYDLVIPPHYYNQLVNFVDTIGYDSKTIKLLFNNLPLDYDLSDFPTDLLQKMYKLSITHEVMLYCKDASSFYFIKLDFNTKEIIQKTKLNLNLSNMNDYIMHITPDQSKFIMNSDHNIHILNNNGGLIKYFNFAKLIVKLFVTNNCIIVCFTDNIKIISIDNYISTDYPINFGTSYAYSFEYNQFICGERNGNIMVIDLQSGEIIRNYNHNNLNIKHVNILGVNKYLSIIDDDINIWENDTCLKSSHCVLYCGMDYDDTDIYTASHENHILIGIIDTIMIHDATDLKLIKRCETNNAFSCIKHLHKNKFLQLNFDDYDVKKELYSHDLKKNIATKIFYIDGEIFDFTFSTNIETEVSKKIAHYLNK